MASEINLVPTASSFDVQTPTGSIPCRGWGNVQEAKAAIVLVHGLGTHSGWFEAVGRLFKVRNIYALAYDQAGFGQRESSEPCSYINWLNDLKTVFHHVQDKMQDRPSFLLGNSMGAMVAAAVAAELRPAGLILTSPAFAGNPRFFTPWFTLKTLFKAIIQSDLPVSKPYPLELVSRDPAVQEWILHDAEFYNSLPAGTFLQLFHLKNSLLRQVGMIESPLLMLIAQQEFIVDNEASVQFFEKFRSSSKIIKEIPSAYHDLMIDPSVEEVVGEIMQFICSNTAEAVPALCQ